MERTAVGRWLAGEIDGVFCKKGNEKLEKRAAFFELTCN
jgi:hypothetical protein